MRDEEMSRRKKIGLLALALLLLLLFIMIGPMDAFTHGFFYEETNVGLIPEGDFRGEIDLADGDYELEFSPQEKHMAGFEIYLTNQPEGNTGTLMLTISDRGKPLEEIPVDLSKVKPNSWYKVYLSAHLKKGKTYTLSFSAKECGTIPHLQCVDKDYLPDETWSGADKNILLVYAYANPTFTPQNKVLIFLYFLSFECGICALLSGKRKKQIGIAALGIFLTAVLSWNYIYNSMDNSNGGFGGFQEDSEQLVREPILAERDGVSLRSGNEKGYGLGSYSNLKGRSNGSYLSDDNWSNGYSKTAPSIIVNLNGYSRAVAVPRNYIVFENGDTFQIKEVRDEGGNRIVTLDSDRALNFEKYGSLDDASFLDQEKNPLAQGTFSSYRSLFGFQGKVWRHLAHYFDDFGDYLNLICSIATASVFVVIVFLIAVKYDRLLAGTFYVTFWLSPWIVNFARNLYWVEFTWFIPMAIGLFCAWKIEERSCREASYVAALVAIFGKSLCGYEYISAVMMGMVAFLAVDFIMAVAQKEKGKASLLFRTTVSLGCCALAGFALALIMHASLRGGGDVLEGLKNIYQQDVLRRTSGGDLNELSQAHWPAQNASIWEVICAYFHFGTEVIAGIPGNSFPLLCTVPLIIFAFEYKDKKLDIRLVVMYAFFFLTSISWLALAKDHSYIHRHMNYVLWYFGFVQTCLYIIVRKLIGTFGKKD